MTLIWLCAFSVVSVCVWWFCLDCCGLRLFVVLYVRCVVVCIVSCLLCGSGWGWLLCYCFGFEVVWVALIC